MPARMSGLSRRWPTSFGGPGDHGSVGIAEDDPRPHRDELVDEEQPALEHLLEDEHGAASPASPRRPRSTSGRRGTRARCRSRSSGSGRRGRPRRASSWPGGTRSGRLPHLELDPELAEGGHDRDEVVRLDVLDRQVAAGHGGERGEARDLDVLGPMPVARRRRAARRPRCGGRSSRRPRSGRRARRGTGRDPGCAARRRHGRRPSRPAASTAAMIAFSVPITDASSRYMRLPTRPFVRRS